LNLAKIARNAIKRQTGSVQTVLSGQLELLENVEERLLLESLLIHVDNDLPEKLLSNAAYDIAKRYIGCVLRPLLTLEL